MGHINFSAGMISTGPPSRPSTGDSTASKTPSRAEFQVLTGFGQHQPAKQEAIPRSDNSFDSRQTSIYPSDTTNRSDDGLPDNSLIDPALQDSLNSPIFHDRLYMGGRPEQYTQSYERYQSLASSTPISAQAPAVSRIRQAHVLEDPLLSPSDSGVRSSAASHFSTLSALIPNVASPSSTPPYFGTSKDEINSATVDKVSFYRSSKRVRYQTDQELDSPAFDSMMPPPNPSPFPSSFNVDSQASSVVTGPPSIGTPVTPASSHSDDTHKTYPIKLSPHASLESPDMRRLSVSSLLCGPTGIPAPEDRHVNANNGVQDWSLQPRDVYQDTTTYGIDRGIKDLDIGKNDDMKAISGSSPIAMRDHPELVLDEEGQFSPVEFGFGMEMTNTAFENGAYYDKPVSICIPRILEPLPNKLLENPMNLLVSTISGKII